MQENENFKKIPEGFKIKVVGPGKSIIVSEDETLEWNPETGQTQAIINSNEISFETADEVVEYFKSENGLNLDPNKVADKSMEEVMDMVDVLNNKEEYSEDEIDSISKELASSVKVPELIENKDDLQESLGLTAEDLKALYEYLSGKGNKPNYLDRYLADNENKLKDFVQIMTLLRLATLPQLASFHASVQARLFSQENLVNMDLKELSAASSSLSKEMNDILNTSIKQQELLNNLPRQDSRYRALIDKLLVVPEDVLNQIEHLINNYE